MAVHAFEYLRSVARTRRGGDLEAAAGFVQMVAHGALDGPDLLVAARRLLERRPESVPLWWSAARLVMAPDPLHLAAEMLDQWDQDQFERDDRDGDDVDVGYVDLGYVDLADVDLADVDVADVDVADLDDADGLAPVRRLSVEAVAASSRRILLEPGDADRMASARLAGRRVVVDVPFGRSLDDALLQCVIDAIPRHGWVVSESAPDTAVIHRGPIAPHSRGLLRRSAI